MKIAAGTLKHSVTIQRYEETQNDFGEVIKGWFDLFTTRASVRPISGKEIAINHSIINEMSHKVYLRYKSHIKPSDRVIFKDRTFNIVSVINHDEQNISQELMCLEIY